MKVLDEKGRLFGKINLIDFAVVLVLAAVIAAVGWKLAGNRITNALEGEKLTIRYEVVCPDVDVDASEFAASHIGGQLMNSGKLLDGCITDCVVEPHTEVVLDADGNPKAVEDPSCRDLRFTIEAKVNEGDSIYSVGSQELRVGKEYIVKTLDMEFNGNITAIEEVSGHG